jgi:aminoglycoside phosphotransferase (APT) family kinase protein
VVAGELMDLDGGAGVHSFPVADGVKLRSCGMSDEVPLAVRLERFLAGVAPALEARVVSVRPISGGYSRVTAVAEVDCADGTQQRLVLRSDPASGKTVFDSDRGDEWALLSSLAGVEAVRIPRPRWFDATGEAFGSKTIVMDHVVGTPLQLTLGGDDDRAARTTYLEVAAALSRIPLDALPSTMSRPASWEEHIEAAIDIYDHAERELADSDPFIRYVVAWLRANRPPPVPLGVVHGDFQPGNILVADGRPPVVIDWEFTRIGDPREDIGYYSGSPLPNSLYRADPDGFLARYRELMGYTEEQVNREVVDYFFVLGMALLFVQMMRGADSLARGGRPGVMAMFLINSLSYFHDRYLDICTTGGRR